LESVAFAPEVIVVDDYSEDRPQEVSSEFKNVKLHTRTFDGFGFQKRYAISLAERDWCLNIDADEEVSPGLKTEIIQVLELDTGKNGYHVRRNNLDFGKFMVDSYPGALRLFRKSRGTFTDSFVHAHVEL